MKRKLDRIMDKPITSIVLLLIVIAFMMVAVACNQPIEEYVEEPIRHQESDTHKAEPMMMICDDIDMPETESVTEGITEPSVVIEETTLTTESSTESTESTIPIPAEDGWHITLKAYAYCPCIKCCGKDNGITATGTKATPNRTIAVDKSVIPYGSRVVIGGNVYIAEDCGGGIKGNTIDVFHASHEEALQWGIKYVDAVVYPAKEVTK